MLATVTVTTILLLSLFIQSSVGFHRVIIDEYAFDDNIRTTRDLGSGRNFSIDCCYFTNCTCPSLYNALTNLTSNINIFINLTSNAVLSSIIPLVNLANITITGHNNPTVYCNNSGGLHFISCRKCTIEGITWNGCGAENISNNAHVYPVLQLLNSSNITIVNCTFQHSIGQAVVLSKMIGDVNIDHCNFLSNKQYEGHGTAIHYTSTSTLSNYPLNFVIGNCNFSNNERAKSVLYYGNLSTKLYEYLYLMDSKFQNNKGVPIYLASQNLVIGGNIELIENLAENGGAIFISDYSYVGFHKNSRVNFKGNSAKINGGAIYLSNHSTILFKDQPLLHQHTVDNQNNEITLNFYHNTANGLGQDIYAHNSNITFGNTATGTFSGHQSASNAVYTENYSTMTFEGNSTVTFQAYKFSGGAVYIANSIVTFKGNSTVYFTFNKVAYSSGGAMSIDTNSIVRFMDSSTVTFLTNSAGSGGALYLGDSSVASFEGNSAANFLSNSASFNYGGAVYIENYCSIKFTENALVTFDLNHADKGGAFYISTFSTVTFQGHSAVNFTKNYGSDGGAMYIDYNSNVIFEGYSKVIFTANNAINDNGGALYVDYSTVLFKGNTLAVFYNNYAFTNGGVVYIYYGLNVMFEENCTVQINNSIANNNGGGIYISKIAIVTFGGYSRVTFHNNTAENDGGAIYIDNISTLKFNQYSVVVLNNNSASFGGSVFVKLSKMTITGNSFIKLSHSLALRDGGAIYLSDHSNFTQFNNSSICFYSNTASDYGGAIYASFKQSLIYLNSSSGIQFKDNTAGAIQNPVYINVPKSCDSNCLFHSVKVTNTNPFPLATSPNKLILYNSAKCIDDNDTECDTYYMNNIMLGQEIIFDACVLDYYNQSTKVTQFVISGMNHQNYKISGSKYISVSCNHTTQRLTVIGNLDSNNSYNYSIMITLYAARTSEIKSISVNLTVELSQCRQYPGFIYSSESQKCECYNTKNIISCNGGNSTIKRGYWFGRVNGKPTVTLCPNNYCNFTCCEITNGVYHLSPVRDNQCRPHRSGTACGNCKDGYTLSFDFPECVDINKCTIGQTILVTVVSLLYWIIVVIAIFVIMYFKVTIGSLYAIVYYYSIVDILLSRVLFISNELYTTVSIMSSLAKLTPQFLGQFCLVRNMSGIDQQVIHYIHPVVASLILVLISRLLTMSRRISSYLSREIIPFVCFLLLLSYTSVAVTSLLIMRPLTFVDIDKVYTYLSPDIEYFHGRHLVYIILAIIFTILIVIGFPLLLLLEPFLNSKINFVKIKPLLDQFQGCYKDKYRCFAGYYMICRLVIILLVIVKIADDFTSQYLLISSCALMQLVHVLVRPYTSTFNNVFDGITLQLIVIISVLPVVEFVDIYNDTFVLVIAYPLIILPLTGFIVIKFWINKNSIKCNITNTIKYLKMRCSHKYNTLPNDDGAELIACKVVDNDSRKCTTTTEVVM